MIRSRTPLMFVGLLLLLIVPARSLAGVSPTVCCNTSTGACSVLVSGSCPVGTIPLPGTTCSPSPCTPTWFAGPWGTCSVTCGGGIQTRTVQCRIGTTVVLDALCGGARPASIQACNTQPCPPQPQWVAGPWGACSTACGPGIQTRTVQCMVGMTIVADSQCAGIRPPTLQSCNLGACTGACCVGSTCVVLTPAACSGSGSYRGDAVACNVPGNTLTPCCLADFNGGGLSFQDIFDFLNAWFASSPNADFDGLNGVDIQDIFAFLNAWFAGCQ